MSDDDLTPIPSIVPTRDSAPTGARGNKRGAGNNAKRRNAGPKTGSGLMARLVLTIALVAAAVACAWAWQLQQQLQQAQLQATDYAGRISDLEDRLSDTDEGMSQNAAVQAAKIRELDIEVRKLWDNVWKKTKERLAVLENSSKKYSAKIAANEGQLKTAGGKLKAAEADLNKLKSIAGELKQLTSNAKRNQGEVERVADDINRLNLEYSKLAKRVKSNGEAINSIDAFRGQVNGEISDIQATLRMLQTTP